MPCDQPLLTSNIGAIRTVKRPLSCMIIGMPNKFRSILEAFFTMVAGEFRDLKKQDNLGFIALVKLFNMSVEIGGLR